MTHCPTCGSMLRNQRYTVNEPDGDERPRPCEDPWHSPYDDETQIVLPRDKDGEILALLGAIDRKLNAHIAETNRRLDVIRAEFLARV